jgi:hypothetical protein
MRAGNSWQLCTFAMSAVINGFTAEPGRVDRLMRMPFKMPKPTCEETLISSSVE